MTRRHYARSAPSYIAAALPDFGGDDKRDVTAITG